MIPNCIICQSVMVLDERLKNQKSKRSIGTYRVRRFKCPNCDYKTTIHADGVRDLELDPDAAIEAVENHFKQEEEARELT